MQRMAGTDPHSKRALVVDADPDWRLITSTAFGFAGFATAEATDGPEALEQLAAGGFDLVVLEADLPSVTGISVLKELRRTSDVAVVMVSASNDSVLRVVALELGADDFCTKPLNDRELVLRSELAIERRQYSRALAGPAVISQEGLTIDPVSRIATIDGAELDLTLKEFDLLVTFASTPGRVFTRGELLEQVWDAQPDWQSVDTVTEHVYRLRQKLDAAGSTRTWIETVRGAGYRFAAAGGPVAVGDRLQSVR